MIEPYRKSRALLIGAKHTALEAVSRVLEAAVGLQVVRIVRDAEEAEAALGAEPVDLIVIHVSTPDPEAAGIVRHLSDSFPLSDIVVFGVHTGAGSAAHFLRAGARRVIREDASLNALVRTACSVLQHQGDGGAVRPRRSRASDLTPRERELLLLVGEGLRNLEIAARLGISLHTVKRHLHNAYEKLGVNSRFAEFRVFETLASADRYTPLE